MRAERKYHAGQKRKRGFSFVNPKCIVCKKEIKIKQMYYNKREHEAHVKCVPKDLIE